ncbi:site-specific integrase [Mucilaginibacter flavidus]|uniref:site-specific integrase n=1 Tax=Mucilaginibacter flavidus TaxID=2949309 RepID=UPI0020921F83|nr:site-specific integrase [Mucilaginibacter flavidus]MCO5948020.1 site-specific integrase [Mucilaginibacter flavidus]
MIRTLCINFTLKKTKILANGTAPIYLRITINGGRVEFTTKRYILPSRWNAQMQKMTGTTEEARIFNTYLKTLEQQIFETHRQMMESKINISAEAVKNRLLGKSEAVQSRMLVPIFKEHNRRVAALIGKEYAAGTLERYVTSLKHTVEFLKWQYKVLDIDIREIDHEFITSYEFYFRSEKNCCNNTAIKYLKNFKKIIRICLSNGWLDKDPFAAFKPKLNEVIPAYLTKEELESISAKQCTMERINQVRDIFLFSCYTGLAYADVKKLKRSEISIGIDGQQWIFTNRKKTDVASRIPLLPIAMSIINRYDGHPQCENESRLLPVLSNQKMNAYLKEIADLCGISKLLTYHTARHTFATTVTLSNGVPIESVSKMLGHKNIKTTQHYAKILDSKVSKDMEALRQKMLF